MEADLTTVPTQELFALYRGILRELKRRKIVRTGNAPAGDYAEYLVVQAFPGSTLAPNSEKSWDVMTDKGLRLQVKCRVLPDTKRGRRQLSVFRTFDFDYAAVVLLADDYSLFRAALVPKELIERNSTYRAHTNGWVCFAKDSLFMEEGVEDLTDRLRLVAGES